MTRRPACGLGGVAGFRLWRWQIQYRVRRLTDQAGQQLLRITRRGTGSPIRLRRAMVVLVSAGGNTVPAIARLVQAHEDTIRQVIDRFNEMGMASLDPQWAGSRLVIGREPLRQILHHHKITFQRTKTWKESTDPDREAKLARIDDVTNHFPQRVFAFDEFGPLVIRPQAGAGWAPAATRTGSP